MADIDHVAMMMGEMNIDGYDKNVDIAAMLFESLSLPKTNKKEKNATDPRNDVFMKLNEILQNEKKAKNLEISIYNWSIQNIKKNKIKPVIKKKGSKVIVNNNDLSWNNSHFKRVYLAKYRSISFNLKNEKNPVFKENVISNGIQIKSIVNMKPEEIFPEVWEATFQRQMKKEMIRLRNEGKELEQAVEGQYTCSKCKCKKINYYELQTRSADEPMTAYFTCLNCNNHWKE